MKCFVAMLWGLGVAFAQPSVDGVLARGKGVEGFEARVAWFSRQALGKPYVLDALGEGPTGRFSQRPLLRLDAYDCLTYVQTVLALALTPAHGNANDVLDVRLRLGYRDKTVAFTQRLHMASGDLLPAWQALGVVRALSMPAKACVVLEDQRWYQHLSRNRVHVHADRKKRLQALRNHRVVPASRRVCLAYVPLASLMHRGHLSAWWVGKPSPLLLAWVRPHWQVRQSIGTNLLVSHVGLVFHTPQGWRLRHASSVAGGVVDVSLEAYLRRMIGKRPGDGLWLGRLQGES